MGQDDVLAVVQLDAKHRAGQNRNDPPFDFNHVRCVIECHVRMEIYTERHYRQWNSRQYLLLPQVGGVIPPRPRRRRGLVAAAISATLLIMSLSSDGEIKKQVGSVRTETPSDRLEQLWQLYLFWKSTPAGQQPQELPPHVRKVVRKAD
jgi:hypothetical protein